MKFKPIFSKICKIKIVSTVKSPGKVFVKFSDVGGVETTRIVS